MSCGSFAPHMHTYIWSLLIDALHDQVLRVLAISSIGRVAKFQITYLNHWLSHWPLARNAYELMRVLRHEKKKGKKTQHYCFGVQLQLQRNEVIALVNLLNRLSESVKLVHDMGQSAEMTMEGQVSAPTTPSCPLQKIWTTFFKGPAPSCPLQRFKRILSSLKQRCASCWVNLFHSRFFRFLVCWVVL